MHRPHSRGAPSWSTYPDPSFWGVSPARGYRPRAIRYLLLSAHYRTQQNFTFEALDQAAAALDRLGLAQWIVARENPLTARVVVNRFWAQLFGRGLVEITRLPGVGANLQDHFQARSVYRCTRPIACPRRPHASSIRPAVSSCSGFLNTLPNVRRLVGCAALRAAWSSATAARISAFTSSA